jgi:hypothetical protein
MVVPAPEIERKRSRKRWQAEANQREKVAFWRALLEKFL